MYPLPKTIKSWISLIAFLDGPIFTNKKYQTPDGLAPGLKRPVSGLGVPTERFQVRPDGSIPRLSELIPDLRDQLMPGGSF